MRGARWQLYTLVAAALALSACAVLSAAGDTQVFDLESGTRRPLSEINEAAADLRAGRGIRTVMLI